VSDHSASAAEVKALRDATGAGIMECKNALRESGGDQEAAVKLLRERGIAKSGKRADRTTTEGLIEAYVHGGRIGVLVEIGCETDFVAGTDEFKTFAHEVALQISASSEARWVAR
jgi:elongation factor Ts